jgi:hypothetical protein
MHQSAAVFCEDRKSLPAVEASLEQLGIELVRCHSWQSALESVVSGRCSTIIVDFDLPGAGEVVRMAAMLPPAQRPTLLAVASQAWPGTGQAFHSGVNRILYRPIDPYMIESALHSGKKPVQANRRKSARYEAKTLVYLEHKGGTLTGISVDIGEHGFAVQSNHSVPVNSSVSFRCVLPGTSTKFYGHADVMWVNDKGRAGLFFTRLTAAARKGLKHWLTMRSKNTKHPSTVQDLLPPADSRVSLAGYENGIPAEARE